MPSLLRTFVEAQFAGKQAKGAYGPEQGVAETPVDLIDIRRDAVKANLRDEIYRLFHPQEGPRELPTLLLYDAEGLQLFEKVSLLLLSAHGASHGELTGHQITYLEEYYLTNAEIAVLQRSAAAIAEKIPSDSMVIELGSGWVMNFFLLLVSGRSLTHALVI